MRNEPCKLLIDKIQEHGTITKCPYCKELFDIHIGMIFLEGKETGDYHKWGHKYFEDVMKVKSGQEGRPGKTLSKPVMANETIRKLIRLRATEIRDITKHVGEIRCPNCEQAAWLLKKKDRENATLCPNCGYDELELDWTDITRPLPRPSTL